MPTEAPLDTVSIKTDYSGMTECTTRLGRIKRVNLVFKDTKAQYPLPALFLIVTLTVNDEQFTYEQALGTQYPHNDHSHEHTHNQITSLMKLTRVTDWNSLPGQPVLVLFGVTDPDTVYGVCDIEKKQFCNMQNGGPVLYWDE